MKYTIIALMLTIFVSCNQNSGYDYTVPDTTDYTAANDKEITDYIAANKLIATKTESGLYYVMTTEGTGANPTATSNVTVAYKGYYTSGKIFDQSADTGITFGLQQVIKGWTEGIPYFKEGGKGMLLIPSHLGYGSSTRNGIPGGSVLLFDIHLIAIK